MGQKIGNPFPIYKTTQSIDTRPLRLVQDANCLRYTSHCDPIVFAFPLGIASSSSPWWTPAPTDPLTSASWWRCCRVSVVSKLFPKIHAQLGILTICNYCFLSGHAVGSNPTTPTNPALAFR